MGIKKVNVNIQGKVDTSKYKNLAELTEEVKGCTDRIEECEEQVEDVKDKILYTNNEDITVDNEKNLILADKQYSAADYSGLGRVYLRKNMVVVSLPFDGFLQTSPPIDQSSLTEVPDSIFFDVLGERFICQKGLKYYINWQNNEGYLANLTDGDLFSYDNKYYEYNDGALAVKENPSKTNVLTQAMLNKNNTIYHIQYDYTLGENITVPANCVLEFDGGSLNGNSTITLQDTYIDGNPSFDCNIEGSIKNDMFNALWIKSGDVGYKVNKAASVFKNILIPQGEYIYTTPIAVEGIKKIVSNADLYYNGEYINNTGIFKIKKSFGAYIYIYCLKPQDNNQLNYLDTRTINAVGLEIQSCNNCEIHFMRAEYFNENLRISDINHSGCCYNKFFIGVLASANFNIRLYQHDAANGISWTNENTFVGGRLTHWTDTKQWGDYWNIGVGGPQIDKPSYVIPGAVDNEGTCNGLTFVGTSIETNRKSLLLYNVSDSQFIALREETTTGLAKIIGRFNNNYYIPKFTDVSNFFRSDLTQATQVSLHNFREAYSINTEVDGLNCVSPSGHIIKYKGIVSNIEHVNKSVYLNYLCNVGVLLPLSSDLCFAVIADKRLRFYVRFIDKNGRNVTESHSNINVAYVHAYNPTSKAYQSTTDVGCTQFHIPAIDGVSKVFVGVPPENKFQILTNITPELPNVKLFGNIDARPKALPAGIAYFDNTIGKVIYTKTTNYNDDNATVWVDSKGHTPLPRTATLNNSSAATYLGTTHADATSDDIGMEVWITDKNKVVYLGDVRAAGSIVQHKWYYADGSVALDESQAPTPSV